MTHRFGTKRKGQNITTQPHSPLGVILERVEPRARWCGGTLSAVSTTDGSARTITQVAGSPYTGQAGLAHTVRADADGIVFVEVELKN